MITERELAVRTIPEILSGALSIYARNALVLLPLGALVIPTRMPMQFIDNDIIRAYVTLGLIVPSFAVSAFATAAMVHSVSVIRRGNRPAILDSLRAATGRLFHVESTEFLALLMRFVTIILFPYFFVRWWFTAQATMLDGTRNWGSMRASSDVVLGRWWRAAGGLLVIRVVTVLLGATSLFAGTLFPLPLWWLRILLGLMPSVVLPFSAAADTLLYLDLQTRMRLDESTA